MKLVTPMVQWFKYIFLALVVTLATPLVGNANIGFPVDPGIRINTYPNPCPRNLFVDIYLDKGNAALEIRLRNVIGKEVIALITDEKTGALNHYEIDLNELPSGVYLLEVATTLNGYPSKTIKRITKN